MASLAPAFAAAVAEVAEVERRRSRLEVDAAVTRARADVEEARLAVQDERETTEAVRAEVAEQQAAMTAKDSEIPACWRSATGCWPDSAFPSYACRKCR